jgi:hypothetical protein
VRQVSFFDGKKRIGVSKTGTSDLFTFDWKTKGARKGSHRVTAVAVDSAGKTAHAYRTLRVCK